MSAATHAARRESRLARIAALFRSQPPPDGSPARIPLPAGMNGTVSHMYLPPEGRREAPHGIATPETLAAIVAEAEAEAERNSAPPAEDPAAISTKPWGPWDKPDGLYMDEQDEYAALSRPFIPELPAWRSPVSAAESAERMRKIVYPPPGSFPERYAAVMWQVSAATGTTGLRERPAAWHRPEIEAPRGAAA